MLPFRLACLFLLLLPAPLLAQERLELPYNGSVRSVLVDAAPGVGRAPLLIALHGGLSGPRTVRRRAATSLPSRGWVVVWPAAAPEWNDGRRNSHGLPYNGTDDVGFIRALVAHLAQEGLVDPNRVFIAGVSLGGTMALRLVCEAPDLVRGAAAALATLPVGLNCPADGPPVPLLLLHGTADQIMPPGGGHIGGGSPFIRDRGSVRSIAETAAVFARRNRCGGYRIVGSPDRRSSRITLRQYTDCAAPFLHYRVNGGGHSWPGRAATAAVEQFFQGLLLGR